MIIVLMGDKHGIQRLEVYTKHLLTKIGAAIDEDTLSSHLHKARTT
jgi:hypothetical protein